MRNHHVLIEPFRAFYLGGTTSYHLPRLILSAKIKIRYNLTVLKLNETLTRTVKLITFVSPDKLIISP
jgi:hypothetical protein